MLNTSRIGTAFRRPRLAAYMALVAVAATPAATSSAKGGQVLAAPTGLQAIQLRFVAAGITSAAPAEQFPRTPSFVWTPVRGAARYHFELSTNKDFGADDAVIWSSGTSATPAATVPVALPWIATGDQYSLYWHVRAAGLDGVSAWSEPAGFRLRWDGVPHMVGAGRGYVRWSRVRGATGYDVWFVNLHKVISTTTTVADLRDYYEDAAPTKVVWRVRATRRLYGPAKNELPAVSLGPWSEANTSEVALNRSASLTTVSDGVRPKQPDPEHKLTPVFLFPAKDTGALHHVYVTTDTSCTNVVFNSAIVRGSAFAPRSVQHATSSSASVAVNDGPVFMKDGRPIKPTEAETSSSNTGAPIDLRDSDRYVWTVVRVERRANGSYHDLEAPQDACRARKAAFSKKSGGPTLGTPDAPFATGLSSLGHLLSTARSPGRFYGFPLVAWKPASGATQYELEWSHSRDAWQTRGTLKTYATSAVLPLTPGTWWYRVRGIDDSIPGDQKLSWSAAARVQITIPIFSVVRS